MTNTILLKYNLSTDIKLSKALLSKINISGEFFVYVSW